MDETLLEYAERERHNDSWWEDVYQILNAVVRKGQSRPDEVARTFAAEPEIRHSEPAPVLCTPTESLTRHRRECVICSVPFFAKRSDALYHSPACRTKASRRRSLNPEGDVTLNAVSD